MPTRKRKEKTHIGQTTQKKKSYQIGSTAPREVFKPGFPMNLFGNLKLFSIIGAGVAVILVLGAVFTANLGNTNNASAIPTATLRPTIDPNVTPSPTAVPTAAKTFSQADQVIDATTKDYRATIKTNKGDIVIRLNADVAPKAVNSFVFLAQKGFFNGITFHRVVKDFVIQSGDPSGNGSGGPGYKTADEPNTVANKRGTISMAKTSGAADFGSQFFINIKDNTSLDFNNQRGDKFYPFATVEKGMDVVDAIGAVATNAAGKPSEPVTIQSVTIEDSSK